MYEALTLAEGIGMVIKLYSLGFFFFFLICLKIPLTQGGSRSPSPPLSTRTTIIHAGVHLPTVWDPGCPSNIPTSKRYE